jgi:hypothetical protein|tara:strand:- start:2628 stop:2762 length:135 start_codon:yes stop_codon:yes gene_type:complete
MDEFELFSIADLVDEMNEGLDPFEESTNTDDETLEAFLNSQWDF